MNTTTSPARVYGGQTHAVRLAHRRQVFIEATIDLVGRHGFKAVSVRSICAQAGLTDRYFYESFSSTESLLLETYEELNGRLKARLVEGLRTAENTLEAKVEKVLEEFFEFLRDPHIARLMLAEILGVSSSLTSAYISATAEFAELILKACDPFLPEQKMPRDDRRILGQALIGAAIYAAVAWALPGYLQPRALIVRSCKRVFMGTLRQSSEKTALRRSKL